MCTREQAGVGSQRQRKRPRLNDANGELDYLDEDLSRTQRIEYMVSYNLSLATQDYIAIYLKLDETNRIAQCDYSNTHQVRILQINIHPNTKMNHQRWIHVKINIYVYMCMNAPKYCILSTVSLKAIILYRALQSPNMK